MWYYKKPRLFDASSSLNGNRVISPFEAKNLFLYLNKSITSVIQYHLKREFISIDDSHYIFYRLLDNSLFLDKTKSISDILRIAKQIKYPTLFALGIGTNTNEPFYRYGDTTYIDTQILDESFVKVLHTNKIDFSINIFNLENDIIGIDYEKLIYTFVKYTKAKINVADKFGININQRELIVDFINIEINTQLAKSYISFSLLNYITSKDIDVELFKTSHNTWLYHSDRILKELYKLYNDTFSKQSVTYAQILKTIPMLGNKYMDSYFNIDYKYISSKNDYIIFYVLAILNRKLSKFNIKDGSVYKRDLNAFVPHYKNSIKNVKKFPLDGVGYKKLIKRINKIL